MGFVAPVVAAANLDPFASNCVCRDFHLGKECMSVTTTPMVSIHAHGSDSASGTIGVKTGQDAETEKPDDSIVDPSPNTFPAPSSTHRACFRSPRSSPIVVFDEIHFRRLEL